MLLRRRWRVGVEDFVVAALCLALGFVGVIAEVGDLFRQQLFGGVVGVGHGGERELAGYVVAVVGRGGAQCALPALCGLCELWEGFAQIAVLRAVLVEVVIELIGDVGNLREEVVQVKLAAGVTRPGE